MLTNQEQEKTADTDEARPPVVGHKRNHSKRESDGGQIEFTNSSPEDVWVALTANTENTNAIKNKKRFPHEFEFAVDEEKLGEARAHEDMALVKRSATKVIAIKSWDCRKKNLGCSSS